MLNLFKSSFKRFCPPGSNRGRFLAYFTVINLIAASMAGILLYTRTSGTVMRQAIDADRNILIQINRAADLYFNQIEHYMDQIVLDKEVLDIPGYYDTGDILSIAKINDRLGYILLSSSYVYDIEIFYTGTEKVFEINNGYFGLDEFMYKDIVVSACDFPASIKAMPYNRIQDKDMPGSFLNVVTMVKSIPMNGAKPEAYVLVNMGEGFFRNCFNALADKDGPEIYIANNNGEIISKNTGAGKYEKLLDKGYLDSLPGENPEHRVHTYDGEKVLISAVRSQTYGWKYISVMPYSKVDGQIQFIKYYSIGVLLLTIIVGVFLSLYFSGRISRPIGSIVSILKGDGDQDAEKDAFKYITKNVYKLLEKKENMEKILAGHMPVLRNNYLTGILFGYTTGRTEIEDRLKYYGISLEADGSFLVYLISIGSHGSLSSRYSERQVNMQVIFLMGVISDLINRENQGIVVNTRPGEIAVVLKLPEGFDNEGLKQRVKALCLEIQETVLDKDKNKYFISLAVGGIHREITQLYLSYEEALEASQHRTFNEESIIFYEEIRDLKEKVHSYPYHKENDILSSLRKCELAEVLKLNKDIFRIFSSLGENSKSTVYYMQLLSSILRCAYELSIDMQAELDEFKLYDEVLRQKDSLETRIWFDDLFGRITRLLEKRKNSSNKSIVEAVENYIRANYDKDMSINALAGIVYMNMDYFRRIFKEETGKSIKQYINEVRVEKAKELLKEPRCKIAEVGEKVGYDKVNAFMYLFKESTGMTPSEYRASQFHKCELPGAGGI